MATHVVHSDPEIMGGTPVFVGTRVPVKNLFDAGRVAIVIRRDWGVGKWLPAAAE